MAFSTWSSYKNVFYASHTFGVSQEISPKRITKISGDELQHIAENFAKKFCLYVISKCGQIEVFILM